MVSLDRSQVVDGVANILDVSPTVKFSLEQVSRPDLYVIYQRIAMLSYKEIKEKYKQSKVFTKVMIPANITERSILDVMISNEDEISFNFSLITEWNLFSKDNPDRILPLPSERPDIWNDLPGLWIGYIHHVIDQDRYAASFLAPFV